MDPMIMLIIAFTFIVVAAISAAFYYNHKTNSLIASTLLAQKAEAISLDEKLNLYERERESFEKERKAFAIEKNNLKEQKKKLAELKSFLAEDKPELEEVKEASISILQ